MEETFIHPTRGFRYQVQYSQRKTVAIKVEAAGIVSVKAPDSVSRKTIEELLETKARWIGKQLAALESYELLGLRQGMLMFQGKIYPVQLERMPYQEEPEIFLQDDKIYLYAPADSEHECLEKAVEEWYREQALSIIEKRVDVFSSIIGKSPRRIRVKTQKTRWGSCSNLGNVNFNWRLVMAPEPIVDYVVVHELCHLVHLNHSRDFWHLVESVLPDYRERINWLKQYGIVLLTAF